MLRLAYDTAGCNHHGLEDALELIAEAGYAGVVLTLSRHHFDPFADDYEAAAGRLGEVLRRLDLSLEIDTGAPYLMDARERTEPALLHPEPGGRARRIDLIRRALRIAALAGGETVVFATGRPRRSVGQSDAGAFLLDGLRTIADAAAEARVGVALAPAPGDIVATVDDFMLVRAAVQQTTDAPLRLALDAGHCLTTRDRDPAAAVREFAPVLASIAIADAVRGSPHRVPFGDGEMNVAALLGALEEIGFDGIVAVSLPRESHRAADSIVRSIAWVHDNLPSD